MNEEEVFACTMNWAIREMKHNENIEIRFKVEGKVYQAKLYYHDRHLRVKQIEIIMDVNGAILYDWEDGVTFDALTVDAIRRSASKADGYNYQLMQDMMENARLLSELLSTPQEGLTDADIELENDLLFE